MIRRFRDTQYYAHSSGVIYRLYSGEFRPLVASWLPNGYETVSISHNGKVTNMYVHRIVAEAFHANPQNKAQVNHKNCIKIDNHKDNLEWVTPRENIDHAVANGRYANNGRKKGTKNKVIT